MQILKELFMQHTGAAPQTIEPITGSGSNRQYVRLTGPDGRSLVGVIGTSRDENHAFIYLSEHFTRRRLPVPKVVAVGADGLHYLQEDLGTRSLFDAIKGGRDAGGRYNEAEKQLLRRTIQQLPNLQVRGAIGLDFTQCYPQSDMDQTSVLFDLNYFKYCFLKATGLDFHELKLEASFKLLAKELLDEPAGTGGTFLYRDFQARNVMIDREGQPHFIDFQGGRRGPLQYDLASFLWQASARYPATLRAELINVYIDALKQYIEVDEARFRQRLRLFVLFRLLQVLGAYGFRGYFERKKHFLESIPPAIENLRQLLAEPAAAPTAPHQRQQSADLGPVPIPPYLRQLLTELVQLPQFQPAPQPEVQRTDGFKTGPAGPFKVNPADGPATYSKYDGKGPLRVRVFSFSFRKGIPADESGNGGGYVFDCRSTHNPGRYEPYKALTGLDEPVIRFLEDDGEILTFLDSVYRLADAHVERYLQRGFTDLMFSFGCTGGQHRSVYSAQHLAEHLHQKYGIEVSVTHREQHIHQLLPAAQ
ncbi:MAG: phosphotransferase [Bacteroidaceae bacterium]|nr:phosphotransferase [Bacteroidaceae bacterium]